MKLNRALMLATLAVSASFAHANDPKATIADLDGRLSKIGAPRVEGTDSVAGKKVVGISQRRTKDAARFQCTLFRAIDIALHESLLAVAVPATLRDACGVGLADGDLDALAAA